MFKKSIIFLLNCFLVISIILSPILLTSCSGNNNTANLEDNSISIDNDADSLAKKLTAHEWNWGDRNFVFYEDGTFQCLYTMLSYDNYDGNWYIEDDTYNLKLSTSNKALTYKDISDIGDNRLDAYEWNVTDEYLYLFGFKYISKDSPDYVDYHAKSDSTKQQTATEAPVDAFEKYGAENNLDDNDINIVRNIYAQINEKYMSLQDSDTEKYTRYPIDISLVRFVYFGENLIVSCHYYYTGSNNTIEFYLPFDVNDKGNLTENDFDTYTYVKDHTNKFGYSDGGSVIINCTFSKSSNDENNKKYLSVAYSEYKEQRQEKFGDLYEPSYTYIDKLDKYQKNLLDNLLNTEDEWGYYYNSWEGKNYPCIYIGIWSFGDGTAEILCTHGTVDFHNENLGRTQYSGTNHGYYIDGKTISELDNSALKRLENDLSGQSKLYWSPEWADKVREEKLAEYIVTYIH